MRGQSITSCRCRRGRKPTLRKCERPIFISMHIAAGEVAASTILPKGSSRRRAWGALADCRITSRGRRREPRATSPGSGWPSAATCGFARTPSRIPRVLRRKCPKFRCLLGGWAFGTPAFRSRELWPSCYITSLRGSLCCCDSFLNRIVV